jgi:hypothetical protein
MSITLDFNTMEITEAVGQEPDPESHGEFQSLDCQGAVPTCPACRCPIYSTSAAVVDGRYVHNLCLGRWLKP